MDRIVEVKVNGTHVWKDSQSAGTQGEGNATHLRIEFDEGWDGFAKTITWWDAKGENPTPRVLTADTLEDIKASTRIYLTPIVPEALAIWGKCMFSIDGYINGRRQRSAYASMVVKPYGNGNDIVFIETPTPSQIEQLQVQIDTILDDIAEYYRLADDAAKRAAASAVDAENSAKDAENSAKDAQKASEDAQGYAKNAWTSAQEAEKSNTQAGNARDEAMRAAINAALSESNAAESADKAEAAAEAYPYVGDNGNWYVWDVENGKFVDTGVPAQGPEGPQGEDGIMFPISGFFTLAVDANGDLWVYAEENAVPDFEYESESGALYIVQEV